MIYPYKKGVFTLIYKGKRLKSQNRYKMLRIGKNNHKVWYAPLQIMETSSYK